MLRQKRRSTISIGSITLGMVALILASGFIEWIYQDMRESTIHSQLGHLQIIKPGYFEAGKADPYRFLFSDDLEQDLLENPTLQNSNHLIKTIVPRLSFSGLISHGDATLSFIGEGVDPQEQVYFGNALKISTGSNLSADHPDHLIMGEGLARNLGVTVGDQVVLLVNTATGGINAVEMTIDGLFSTVTKSYDDNALRLPISTAQQLLRTQGAHSWVVLLNDTHQTDAALAALRNTLSQDRFEIVPWYQLADFYNKTTVLFTKQVQAIKLIIALIILLGISNTMTMNVVERTGEIGTAMALGVKKFDILRQFLCEGALIGGIGGALGILIGWLLAAIISSIGIPMPPPPGMARGYTGEILLTSNMVLEALALAILTTLIASVYPAWKASRMQIVDALRHNR
ncbi:ABC transporter permease [Nitrosomonas europaea]|nr:FtsX-like permease family protein [Nitrosomonas europaea]SDW62084.1 putative ABC transport system permease protein [Nitrosomonas europaea]SET33164.1 putative ABC transport system permease protein [Nitrosomonas europaea]SJZ73395.1 putative ABC transport system permease protein [Nitrosomonas europaea]